MFETEKATFDHERRSASILLEVAQVWKAMRQVRDLEQVARRTKDATLRAMATTTAQNIRRVQTLVLP